MGKNLSREEFKSDEEWYTSWYLDELLDAKYIEDYNYEPHAIELSPPVSWTWEKTTEMKTKTKVEIKSTTLLQGHEYTYDFSVLWASKAKGVFYQELGELGDPKENPYFVGLNGASYLETKPSFDAQNMSRLAVINIKWVYQKFGIYVQKVVPIPSVKKSGKMTPATALFPSTFTPKKYLFTNKSGKPRAIRFPVLTMEEYVKTRK